MLEVFDNYVKGYDLTNEGIKAKYNHSYRVMELSEKYARLLNFNEEDIEIAKIIGLLHDYGRFEQYKKYHSFDDENMDHADYSAYMLFNKGEIEKLSVPKEYYEIIEFAIKNHNKVSIPPVNDNRKLMHAKLIRDVDKLDIIYLLGYLKQLNLKTKDEMVSKEILESFNKHKTIDRKLCQNASDRIVVMFAFVFDINNDICLRELKRNYKYFYKRLKDKKFIDIYLEVLKYINERIDRDA